MSIELLNYYGGVKIVVTTPVTSGRKYELRKKDLYITGNYDVVSDATATDSGTYVVFYDFAPVWGTVYEAFEENVSLGTATLTKCDSVSCISDATGIYPIYADVTIGNVDYTNNIASYNVMNSAYPVFITTYDGTETQSGQVTFRPLGLGVNLKDLPPVATYNFDRILMEKDSNNIMKMLTNKRPKCLKIPNRNIMIVMITGKPQIAINNNNHVINFISFNFTECAEATYTNRKLYGMVVPPEFSYDAEVIA